MVRLLMQLLLHGQKLLQHTLIFGSVCFDLLPFHLKQKLLLPAMLYQQANAVDYFHCDQCQNGSKMQRIYPGVVFRN